MVVRSILDLALLGSNPTLDFIDVLFIYGLSNYNYYRPTRRRWGPVPTDPVLLDIRFR